MQKKKRNILFITIGIIFIFMLTAVMVITWYQHDRDHAAAAPDSAEKENSFTLDVVYENAYRVATSNYKKSQVNLQFADKWKLAAEYYLEALYQIADDDLKQALIAGQEAWEKDYQIRMDERYAYLEYVYRGGTIIPILSTRYAYDLQRERALELYEMYTRAKGIWEIDQQYGGQGDGYPVPSEESEETGK